MRILPVIALALLANTAAIGTALADELMLNIRTEDCKGNTGIASVQVDNIYRTQPYQCPDGDGKKTIRQLLVKSGSKTGGYDVFYITEAESRRIDSEITKILESRKKGLEKKHTIEINPK